MFADEVPLKMMWQSKTERQTEIILNKSEEKKTLVSILEMLVKEQQTLAL